jgi:PBSX family phage terminase large subunit
MLTLHPAPQQITKVIRYQPLPKQAAFHNSPAKYRMYSGCWGGGKTKAGCQEGIKLSLKYPGNHGMILRQNFPELRDTTMATFFEELEVYEEAAGVPLGDPKWGGSEGVVGYNAGKMSYRFRPVQGQHSMVFFKYATGAGRLMAEHLKSFNLGWYYIDEGTDVTRDVWTQLTGRLRRPNTDRRGFTTTNPGSEEHWLYDIFYVQDLPDHEVIETNIYENVHLPADYIKGLEQTLTEDERKRYMLGEWGRFKGQIYSWFEKAIHVKDVDITGQAGQLLCGVDHGYADPAVLLPVHYDGNTIRLIDEFYQSGRTTDEVIEAALKLQDTYGTFIFIADPSNPDMIERMRRAGLTVIPNKKKNVVEGISAVSSYNDRMEVDPKCANTIKEFGSYQWKKVGGVIQADVPEDKNNHAMDAIRYVVVNLGRGGIRKIGEL